MIIMIEAPGLPEKISAAGHWVQRHVDGNGVAQWLCSDEVAVQAIIDSYTPAEASAYVCALIDAFAKQEFERHAQKHSPYESAGWPIKRAEAFAYQADPLTPTPNLLRESIRSGRSVPDIVARVLTNADYWERLQNDIIGSAAKHKDAVRALTSFNEISSYNWRTGWPA